MKWTSFSGHLAFVLSILLALGCVHAFRIWHKRRARRSPLAGKKLGNLPGQQLLMRIDDHQSELLLAAMLMMLSFPLMFAVWAGMRVKWEQMRFGGTEIFFLLATLMIFGYALARYIKHYRLREQAQDGLIAERVTGMQLNRLVAKGCLVLHDLPAEGFNIDHVVIAPKAVYAVETKSVRKPKDMEGEAGSRVGYDGKSLMFPSFNQTAPLDQAVRQAQWLRRALREALDQEFPVIPAVALPGWYIEKTHEAKRAEVVVFTPIGKGAEFMSWAASERISEQQRHMISQALALRYSTQG